MSTFLDKESEFRFEDLFFSRTNMRGVIESGNSVFQRVSKFQWEELLQKPHSLIRHPAMPRAVFHLLWETILANKQIGAYVVNKAKDGSYYWVFAVVFPVEGGFVSVRLKPSSPILGVVKQKYAELLEIEKAKKLQPKDSQAVLLQVLEGLKFRGYSHFMSEALTQEMESRQKSLGREPDRSVLLLRELQRLAGDLRKKSEEIFAAYRASSLVPLNLQVQATRIGQEAAPIAVVSSQYDELAQQIQNEAKKFAEAGARVQATVERCQFEVCGSTLQSEMVRFFADDHEPTPIQKEIEMGLLQSLCKRGRESAAQSLREIQLEFQRFRSIYEDVRRLSTAIEMVSVAGKIEAAKIKQATGDLAALLDDLGTFKTALKTALKEIDEIGAALVQRTSDLSSSLS